MNLRNDRRHLPVLLALLVLAWVVLPPARAALDYRLTPRVLAPGVYVFEGAVEDFSAKNGCNIINTGFIVTGAGVVVINTGPSRLYGEQQRAAIEKVTSEPVVLVINLNLHPDYFFGNQAYSGVRTVALAGTIQGMKREGPAYEQNLYRICGDWMRGTEAEPARDAIDPGSVRIGNRELELMRMNGHTSDDLVVIDRGSGVVFAGGLVFVDRAPTTPHARISEWMSALDKLRSLRFSAMVPSHGHVVADARGIEQTSDYLGWLDRTLADAARGGLDLTEVLASPVPQRFRMLGAIETEFVRNVTHLYPRYEQRELRPL